MGAKVGAPGPNEPFAGSNEGFIHSTQDIERIPSPDPYSQGRQPLMLDALRLVKESLGDDVFLVGCFDQSPFSLACAVGGIARIMVQTLADPGFLQALMDRCVAFAISYGQAMAKCGADMLSTGDSPVGLVGPAVYHAHCLPAEQRVFDGLRTSTDCKLSLHICGNATTFLPDMAKSGADVLEIDHLVEIERACQLVPDDIALWGNIDPVGVLLHENADRVETEATLVLRKAASNKRRRFVLSSGCTLAPATPSRNIQALLRAARRFPEKQDS
jgi:MtaA/CmuA family methyltransferase